MQFASAVGNRITIWDASSGQAINVIKNSSVELFEFSFSSDGRNLFTNDFSDLKKWDLANGGEVHTICERGDAGTNSGTTIHRCGVSPDGSMLQVIDSDGSLTIKDTVNQERIIGGINAIAKDMGSFCCQIEQSLDNRTLKIASFYGREIILVDTSKLRIFPEISKEWGVDYGRNTALSPDGKMLAVVRQNKLTMLDVVSGKAIYSRDITCSGGPEFSPDGNALAISNSGVGICFVDASTGETRDDFLAFDTIMGAATFSRDGKYLTVSGNDGVKAWEIATKQILISLENGFAPDFTPDGKYMALINADRSISLWDVSSSRLVVTISSFIGGKWTVTTPDGRYDSSNNGETPYLHWVVGNTIPLHTTHNA